MANSALASVMGKVLAVRQLTMIHGSLPDCAAVAAQAQLSLLNAPIRILTPPSQPPGAVIDVSKFIAGEFCATLFSVSLSMMLSAPSSRVSALRRQQLRQRQITATAQQQLHPPSPPYGIGLYRFGAMRSGWRP
jgi:hypothetical protein